nr:T9SS type A sorting domain-containing protein [Saprospiraceae bacterium]
VFLDSLDATTNTKLIADLQSLTLYSFEVYAFDLAGNNSGLSEITLSTTAPLVTAEPGLVAHYPFEGNANDATPYNNHGVIGGNPVFETSTHSGGGMCLKFDGNGDSVLVANSVQMLSDFTSVSFWIRVDGTNLADAESYVIDFGHWDQRFKISLPQHLKIVFTTNGNNAQFPNFISDMDSGDGNEMVKTFWWNVVMVHDGEKDLIYVNGFKANEKPVPTALNSTNRPMCFASNPIEGGQYFNGALDEIKIYNKALTAAEIEKLFTSGTTGINETKDLSKYDVKVFPNPVVDQVNINHNFGAKESIRVRIFDLLGRQVGQEILRGNQINQDQITINTQHYKTGMYILNFVIDDKEVGSTNFIK